MRQVKHQPREERRTARTDGSRGDNIQGIKGWQSDGCHVFGSRWLDQRGFQTILVLTRFLSLGRRLSDQTLLRTLNTILCSVSATSRGPATIVP